MLPNRFYLISLLITALVNGMTSNARAATEATDTTAETPLQESAPQDPAPVTINRESEISQRLAAQVTTAEALWLGEGEHRFIALFEESNVDNIRGAVILLHDLGGNADLPQLISPIRRTLPDKGWHMLSLQLPIVNADEGKHAYLDQFEIIQQRIEAGIAALQQKNITEIVIIGHGLGAAAGILYISGKPQSPVKAIVGISIPGANSLLRTDSHLAENETQPDTEPQVDIKPEEGELPDQSADTDTVTTDMTEVDQQAGKQLDLYLAMNEVTLPLLDIYGTQDHQDVIREAEIRAAVMHKTENANYLQLSIQGADHAFHGLEDRLIRRIRGWLTKIISVKSG